MRQKHAVEDQGSRPFLNKVLILLGASTVAPLLLLLAHPLLARLYMPAEYGMFGIFEASLSILVTISVLSYNLPIPVMDTDAEARALLLISVLTSLGFSLLLYALLIFWGAELTDVLNAQALLPYLPLLALAVFISGCGQSYTSWAVRRQEFAGIAMARLGQGATQASTQVGLGLLSFNFMGLISGLVIGRLCGLVILAHRVGMQPLRSVISDRGTATLARTAWRHRNYPLLATWSAAISAVKLQLAVLLVNYYFGTEITGLFSLAFWITAGPIFLINGAVVQAFLADVGTLDRQQDLARASLRLFQVFLQLAVAPCLLFMWLAPDIFSWVFGENWRDAGVFARLLAPVLLVSFVGSHLPAVVIIRNKQHAELCFNVLHLVAGALVLALVASHFDATVAIAGYSAAGVFLLLSYDIWLLRVAGAAVKSTLKILVSESALACILLSPLLVDYCFFAQRYATLAIYVSVSCVLLFLFRGYRQLGRSLTDKIGP